MPRLRTRGRVHSRAPALHSNRSVHRHRTCCAHVRGRRTARTRSRAPPRRLLHDSEAVNPVDHPDGVSFHPTRSSRADGGARLRAPLSELHRGEVRRCGAPSPLPRYGDGWTDAACGGTPMPAPLGQAEQLKRADCTTRDPNGGAVRRLQTSSRTGSPAWRARDLDAMRPTLDGRQVLDRLGLEPGPCRRGRSRS